MTQLLAHLFGDYILQSDWMAQNKTKADAPAMIHALIYSLCFVPLIWFHGRDFRGAFACWIVIFISHFLIDRYRLACYVVWAKNHIGPKGWCYSEWNGQEQTSTPKRYWPWRHCDEFGCTPNRMTNPAFLSAWLLIIADNTLHLAINYAALRWL